MIIIRLSEFRKGDQVVLSLYFFTGGLYIMAVKIFIKRRIKKAKADEAIALMNKFRMDAMNQPGYISGETLVNHYDPQRVTVVSTWQSVDDWINWEQSDQRAATEEQLESLLLEPTRFEIYDLGILPKK